MNNGDIMEHNAMLHGLEKLRSEFSGEIILPGDEQYPSARNAYVFPGSPAIIVRPDSHSGIARALRYCREQSLVLSIRSGGHGGAGYGTNSGGLVIDLCRINSVEVIDPVQRRVRIGTGAVWKNVAESLQQHGLALTSGDSVSVGVGGLTLGGGIGWMVRKYGLTIDSLVAADVVNAEGELLRASADEHPDLFWAIRGGGGNFGIVTHFEFTAQSVAKVHAGMIMYSLNDLHGLLKGWRDVMVNAPEELTTTFLLVPSMAGAPPMAILQLCCTDDDPVSAMRMIDPLLHIGTVLQQNIALKRYSEVLEEAHPPEGVKIVVNNRFAESFNDDLVQIVASRYGKETSPILQIRSIGGALNRVKEDATAFRHRKSSFLFLEALFLPKDASDDAVETALASWRSILPFMSGSYVNFLSSSDAGEMSVAYPRATYDRLTRVKKIYDPENVFNRNHNIPPAANK